MLELIQSFREREKRLLLVIVSDRYDDFIEKFSGSLDHVEVAIGDRIEAAWINRAFHFSRNSIIKPQNQIRQPDGFAVANI